jgi:hypothetical membrane protein
MGKEKNTALQLNQEIVEQLELKTGQEIELELYADKLVLRKEEKLDCRSLPGWIAIVSSVLFSLAFFGASVVNDYNQILLVGSYSITTFLIGFGSLLGLIFFTTTFILNRNLFLGGIKTRVFWRILPVIVASFTAILILILLGVTWVLNQIFTGASFDRLTSTIILGVSLYAVSITWGQVAERIRATWLTTLLIVIMISGVLLSMATNSSREWWQFNLSFLGTQNAANSWQFNVTLILSALILVALVDYLFVALGEKYAKNWKFSILRILLTLLGLDLGAVGYFPNDASSHLVHTRLAGYLVYIIILLIISIRWLLPTVTRDFLISSYTIGAILVGLEIAFQAVHYLSLTAFEMSAFILAFTWLIMLFNHLESLLIPEKKKIIVQIH